MSAGPFGDRGGPAESDLRRSGGSSAPAARPKRRKFGSGGATAEGLDPTEEVRLRRRGDLRRDPAERDGDVVPAAAGERVVCVDREGMG